ncbi:SAM-dependent RNA methyltransferase [Ampelomyces quisqualis]|uniref:SAM-dependent RNA methyltransferase n=1 Tax=Ampelomyces quisqualis TaxID=50730 RepID=A0A6A5R242_AMPQU|nr:SAM-dependent RNA methyltransferase [Ampelomyces quisqualis]
MAHSGKTFVVEHLDPELEAWSSLEYSAIASESHATGARFLLSSVPASLKLPEDLQHAPGLNVETRGIEEIYAHNKDRVCLLDPAASKDLCPDDGDTFDIFLFGGILGDDPPRDRTSELRKKGYQGRRLGPLQMTTDTAVRVTRIVVQDRIPVDKIPFVDHPELKINKNESTQMPFRYVKGHDGSPIMPEGMVALIIRDSEKSLDDLL